MAVAKEEPSTTTTSSGARIVPWDAAVKVLRQYSVADSDRPQVLGVSEAVAESAFRDADVGNKGYLTEAEWRRLCTTYHIAEENNDAALRTIDTDRLTVHLAEEKEVQLITRMSQLAGDASTRVVRFFEGFVSGGVAGAVSKTVIAPADRVKIIYQVDPNRQFSLRAAAKTGKRIAEKGGVRSLWNGNGATMLRIVPYASTTFLCFDHYHDFMKGALGIDDEQQRKKGQSTGKKGVLARFIAGGLAGATATTLTYPLDFMRARFAAHWDPVHPRYPSYRAAFVEVVKLEGWQTLYRGLNPTLAGIMPYAGSSFACFETFKQQLVLIQNFESERDIPTYQRLMAGSISGLIAQSLTYPLDIVRRRMQVHPDKHRTVRGALVTIYKQEGLRNGLYKGLAMNWIKGPIAVSCSFTVNDLVKQRIRRYHAEVVEADRESRSLTQLSFAEKCLCGGVAGGVAKFWTAPIDRLKIMYALGKAHADEHTWGRDGFKHMAELYRETPHMWQGAGAMMTRVIPYAAITYASFEFFESIAKRFAFTNDSDVLTHFVGGAMAASVATVCLHPLDLLRVRNAAFVGGQRYVSYRQGLSEMMRGGRGALFEGLRPAVLGIAPTAGMGFAMYFYLRDNYGCDTFASRLAAGCTAGVVAQTMTYPLNIVRRSAQFEDAVNTSVFRTLTNMASTRGYQGLYHRMPFGWMMGATTAGLSFAINDQCRELALTFKLNLHDSAIPKHLRDAIISHSAVDE